MTEKKNPLQGEIWTCGPRWATTSFGVEALNGSCSIPHELFCDATLTAAAEHMSRDELSEFVHNFATALMLHGKCPMVRQEVVHEVYRAHLAQAAH